MTAYKVYSVPNFTIEAVAADYPCIGTATDHQDGKGFTFSFETFPATGKVVLRQSDCQPPKLDPEEVARRVKKFVQESR